MIVRFAIYNKHRCRYHTRKNNNNSKAYYRSVYTS